MTITLTEIAEAKLRKVAVQRGLSAEDALEAVLSEAEREFSDTVADVRASLDEIAAGKTLSLEEFHAQEMAHRRQRDTRAALLQNSPQ